MVPSKVGWSTMEREHASPMVYVDSIMITGIIHAKEDCDDMTGDVPNIFIQANIPKVKQGEDRVMMKITGALVDMLVQLAPKVYGPCVVFEDVKNFICGSAEGSSSIMVQQIQERLGGSWL